MFLFRSIEVEKGDACREGGKEGRKNVQIYHVDIAHYLGALFNVQ